MDGHVLYAMHTPSEPNPSESIAPPNGSNRQLVLSSWTVKSFLETRWSPMARTTGILMGPNFPLLLSRSYVYSLLPSCARVHWCDVYISMPR